MRDGKMLTDPRYADRMVGAVEQNKIPYQGELLLGGTTDVCAMQLVSGGIPVGCRSIPRQYPATPLEMIDFGDFQDVMKIGYCRLAHEGIETGLNYRRDVTFHEDATRMTTGSTGHMMTSINNLFIALIRQAIF
ncbi:MAG: hypothetical protein WAN58_12030 [Anaerolineales bacterium]